MPSSIDAFGASILIVDDQESNARLLDFALRRGGYSAVTSTTNPREVCSLHRQNHYDLILLDLQMPCMNGFEVMEGLAIEGKVAILVLSGDPTQMTRALKAGGTSFLSKPFVLAEVLLRVKGILSPQVEELVPVLATAPAAVPLSSLRVVL
jgi:CheY-like chemotaxis protein